MICYRIPTHPIIRHAIGRVTWHGIRQVATIVCIATPVWLVPAPAAPGAPGVPEYVVPGDMPPVMLPWPGDTWTPPGSPGAPMPGLPPSGVPPVPMPTYPPVSILPPAFDTPPSAVSAVPHSDVPEPAGLAMLLVGLFVLGRVRWVR